MNARLLSLIVLLLFLGGIAPVHSHSETRLSPTEPPTEAEIRETTEEAKPELERPTVWGEPTEVRVGIFVIDIDEVDSAKQSFAASIYLEAHWDVPAMRHEGPGPVHRAWTQVWTPRLTIINQQQAWSAFPESVEILPSGEVIYRQKVWGRFSQSPLATDHQSPTTREPSTSLTESGRRSRMASQRKCSRSRSGSCRA